MGKDCKKVYVQGPTGATGSVGVTGPTGPSAVQIKHFSSVGVNITLDMSYFPVADGNIVPSVIPYATASPTGATGAPYLLFWTVPYDGIISGFNASLSASSLATFTAGAEAAKVSLLHSTSLPSFSETLLTSLLGPVPNLNTFFLSDDSAADVTINVSAGDNISVAFLAPTATDPGWNQVFPNLTVGGSFVYERI